MTTQKVNDVNDDRENNENGGVTPTSLINIEDVGSADAGDRDEDGKMPMQRAHDG